MGRHLTGKQVRYLWAIGYFKSGGHKGKAVVGKVTATHRTASEAATHVIKSINEVEANHTTAQKVFSDRAAQLTARRKRVYATALAMDTDVTTRQTAAFKAHDEAALDSLRAENKLLNTKSQVLLDRLSAEIYAMQGQSRDVPIQHDYLDHVVKSQGFNGLPSVHTQAQMDVLVADKGNLEIFRGTGGTPSKTPSQVHEQLRSGKDFFIGSGVYGNGTYVSPDRSVAQEYAGMGQNSVIRGVITSKARVITHDRLLALYEAQVKKTPALGKADESAFAAAMGYDVVHVAKSTNYVPQSGFDSGHRVVLNRRILGLQQDRTYTVQQDRY